MRHKVTNTVGTGRIARSNEFGDNLKEICAPSYMGSVWFHMCRKRQRSCLEVRDNVYNQLKFYLSVIMKVQEVKYRSRDLICRDIL